MAERTPKLDIYHSKLIPNKRFHVLRLCAPPNTTKNPMQLVCFTPNFPGFGFQFRFGHSDHSKKKLRFTRFFSARANAILEIRPGNAVIRFAIICAYTGTCSYQLINQTIIYWAPRYLLREKNYPLSKSRRSLFQVINQRLRPFAQLEFMARRFKSPKRQIFS
jgi:hypothetical protein